MVRAPSREVAEAWACAQRDALVRARKVIDGRREFASTGVHAVAELLGLVVEGYSRVRPSTVKQVRFVSDDVEEPSLESNPKPSTC